MRTRHGRHPIGALKHAGGGAAALLLALLGAGVAGAQTVSITPVGASSGDEGANVEFNIDASWAHSAEINWRLTGVTATAGEDFMADSGTLCHNKESVAEGYSGNEYFGCDNGGQPTSSSDNRTNREYPEVVVLHYSDDPDVYESAETYRVEAWITRYQTGQVDGDDYAIWRDCPMQMGRRYSGVPGSRLGVEPMRVMDTDTMAPGASGMDLHGQMYERHPLEGASFAMTRRGAGGVLSVWSRSARSSFTGQQGSIDRPLVPSR